MPVRVLPVPFVETVNDIHPDPVSSVLVVIHESVVVAVQEHEASVVRKLVPTPPSGVIVRVVGLSVNGQVFAAWVTVKVRPATVSVPVRCVERLFASTRNATRPVRVPLVPVVIVIQGTLLTAVQVQESVVVTIVAPVPPFGLSDKLVGEIEYEQVAPA